MRNVALRHFSISLFFLLVCLTGTQAVAQKTTSRNRVSFGSSVGITTDTTFLDVDQDIAVQLMPFDDLVKVAVANSPLMKFQSELIDAQNATYQLSKVQILQNASGNVGYAVGNQLVIPLNVNDRQAVGSFNNGYRAGVDLRFSLADVFGRKHQIKQAYSNYRSSIIQKDILEQQLRREMIGVYQDMITTQQILKLRLADEQAAFAALRVAEVENQKGRITSDVFATANSRYVEARVTTEQLKGDFIKNVHQFEALVGWPIQRMKRF